MLLLEDIFFMVPVWREDKVITWAKYLGEALIKCSEDQNGLHSPTADKRKFFLGAYDFTLGALLLARWLRPCFLVWIPHLYWKIKISYLTQWTAPNSKMRKISTEFQSLRYCRDSWLIDTVKPYQHQHLKKKKVLNFLKLKIYFVKRNLFFFLPDNWNSFVQFFHFWKSFEKYLNDFHFKILV